MRWKTARAPRPKEGDTRNRCVFAWMPVEIEGVAIWLEYYAVTERYEGWRESMVPGEEDPPCWVVIRRFLGENSPIRSDWN